MFEKYNNLNFVELNLTVQETSAAATRAPAIFTSLTTPIHGLVLPRKCRNKQTLKILSSPRKNVFSLMHGYRDTQNVYTVFLAAGSEIASIRVLR